MAEPKRHWVDVPVLAAEPKRHWVDVPVLVEEVDWAAVRPGDEVWYFIRHGRRYGPDAHGPFKVLDAGPGWVRLENQNSVSLTFRRLDRLVPLKRVQDPCT